MNVERVGALLLALWIAVILIDRDRRQDDMAICQLQNSHDVCFQTLNR